MGKIIAFYNTKCTGKTTTCVNLGACLAEQGKKVLIVDMDRIGRHATSILVTNDEKSIKSTQVENLFIIPRSEDPFDKNSRKDWDLYKDNGFVLRKQLEKIRGQFDYILIDCPPISGPFLGNALVAADSVMIPVFPVDWFHKDLQTTKEIIYLIKGLNLNLNVGLGAVLGEYKPNKSCASVEYRLTKRFGDNFYCTRIPFSKDISEASKNRKLVCLYKPKSKATKAYRELAKEFLEKNS